MACGDDDADGDQGGRGGSTASESGRGGNGGSQAGAGRGGSGSAGKAGSASNAGRGGEGGSDASSDGSPIEIRFKAKVGDSDLDCREEYDGQGSTKVRARVQDFRVFVEEVSLIKADGEKVRVVFEDRAPFQTKDVALLDFTERTGACINGSASVNTTITGRVPDGEYTGIEFVNGVPETLNHKNITTQKAPLQDPSLFWGWQSGYRFIVAEILPTSPAEAADAGSGEVGTATFVHIGSAACTGSNADGYSCARPNRNRVVLDGFDPAKSTIVADLGKVFAMVDLSKGIECHGPNPECANMYASFGIEQSSGKVLETQSVYRVE